MITTRLLRRCLSRRLLAYVNDNVLADSIIDGPINATASGQWAVKNEPEWTKVIQSVQPDDKRGYL